MITPADNAEVCEVSSLPRRKREKATTVVQWVGDKGIYQNVGKAKF